MWVYLEHRGQYEALTLAESMGFVLVAFVISSLILVVVLGMLFGKRGAIAAPVVGAVVTFLWFFTLWNFKVWRFSMSGNMQLSEEGQARVAKAAERRKKPTALKK